MKLSIITINYNNIAGLQKTIDSVICQTWKDFEWIIIDGGSTDGSKELIEQYQQHFAYWCSEPDKGVYNAMNKGIAQAQGGYLIFMNSGDCFYDKLILENIFNENLHGDVVYGDCIKTDGKKDYMITYPHHVDFEFFYMRNLCHQAMLIKSSLFIEDGYDESYKILGDWVKWLKIAYEGGEFQYVPFVICRFDIGGISELKKDDVLGEYRRMIKELPISNSLSDVIIDYKECKHRLYEYEECILTKDTLMLVKESPLFIKLIHLNLIILMGLKKVLKFVGCFPVKCIFALLFLHLFFFNGYSQAQAQNEVKILFVGSSHGRNTIGQFPILAYHSGVDVVCGNAYAGGLPIGEIADLCKNGGVFRELYKKFYDGVWHDNIPDMTILKMLQDEEWDIISIQRSAAQDRYWNDDHTQNLETILQFIKENCTYKPTIVFNSGFADSYSIDDREKQQEESNDIWTSVQYVKDNYSIEIIPMAPILQLLRNNDELAGLGTYKNHMLSHDGQHLDLGIGMYASGCICYDFFLRKRFGKKIIDCTYLPTAEDMMSFWYEESKFTPIEEKYAKMIREVVDEYYTQKETTGVPSVYISKPHDSRIYSIYGREVQNPKGLVIIDGKKYFKK